MQDSDEDDTLVIGQLNPQTFTTVALFAVVSNPLPAIVKVGPPAKEDVTAVAVNDPKETVTA